jgi:LCP family protein required for cell wall assembly
MSRTERSILTFLVIIAMLLCILVTTTALGVAPVLMDNYMTRLNLPAQVSTWFSATPSPQTSNPSLQGIPPSPSFTPLPEPLCGGPRAMNILAIGTDSRANSYLYGLADVTRIVRVDFVSPKVMILDFPRDLYVEIPEISHHYGITHGKLNQAYLYGNPGFGYYDGPGKGPGLLARTLELNFGMPSDHYLAVNMQTFVKIVDAVDGIDIVLPYTVDGRSEEAGYSSSLYFHAGTHHLNGTQALVLGRLRPNGVFERSKQQNLILSALRDRLLDPSILQNLPAIFSALSGSIQTDLGLEQLGWLSCLAPKITKENIFFASWPENMFVGTRVDDPVLGWTFIWDVDFNLIRAYVSAFNNGQWPAAPPPTAVPSPTLTQIPDLP